MNKLLQPVRGTHDLTGDAARRHRQIADVAAALAALYGYGEVQPPVFEFSEVFHRTLGETSDVITKETYTFTDRGGESLTLRPEFTASVVRAFLTAGLTQQLPFKAFYYGPAFRYERPQKGRQRQFFQVGAEILGADAPWSDAEIIASGWRLLGALGIRDGLALEINTLGDRESRESYRAALVAYLERHTASLSEESRVRLVKNPLRVLDSKQPEDRAVIAGAPILADYLSNAAAAWFDGVRRALDSLGVSYKVSDRLVRGLDYYTHTVFEVTTSVLGAQNTVLAGGRYNGLVEAMGGPDIPGVGWAAGVERLALLMDEAGVALPGKSPPVAVIPLGEAMGEAALALAEELRDGGIAAEIIARGNIGKALKKADALGARFAVMLGPDELAQGTVGLKNLRTGEQASVKRAELIANIR